MQPVRSGDVLTSDSPVLVARDAYFRGDFDACLAALDGAKNVAPSEQREALLLRARTLIRTLQLPEVVQLLGPQLGTFAVIDEACTARMLHAVGVLRSPGADSVERGSALLAEVHVAALTPKAHPAICGEIEYWIAFGCWMRRDFHATLKHAFVAEGSRSGHHFGSRRITPRVRRRSEGAIRRSLGAVPRRWRSTGRAASGTLIWSNASSCKSQRWRSRYARRACPGRTNYRLKPGRASRRSRPRRAVPAC